MFQSSNTGTPAMPIFEMTGPDYDKRIAAAKVERREAGKRFELERVTTITHYSLKTGDGKHYSVERDHKPARPDREFKVYGWHKTQRVALDLDGPTAKRVIRALKDMLADGPIENT